MEFLEIQYDHGLDVKNVCVLSPSDHTTKQYPMVEYQNMKVCRNLHKLKSNLKNMLHLQTMGERILDSFHFKPSSFMSEQSARPQYYLLKKHLSFIFKGNFTRSPDVELLWLRTECRQWLATVPLSLLYLCSFFSPSSSVPGSN